YPVPDPADPTGMKGGDVKNLASAPGGMDSVWVDLGYPVKTLPDGRKYKPLFAFLIRDLDGLVNVNVHGNIRINGNTHGSNQGFGKTEINLSQVLTAPGAGPNPEWTQLFRGNPNYPSIPGRYGPDGQPGVANTQAPAFQPTPPYYAYIDYDGAVYDQLEKNGAVSPKLVLPSSTGTT